MWWTKGHQWPVTLRFNQFSTCTHGWLHDLYQRILVCSPFRSYLNIHFALEGNLLRELQLNNLCWFFFFKYESLIKDYSKFHTYILNIWYVIMYACTRLFSCIYGIHIYYFGKWSDLEAYKSARNCDIFHLEVKNQKLCTKKLSLFCLIKILVWLDFWKNLKYFDGNHEPTKFINLIYYTYMMHKLYWHITALFPQNLIFNSDNQS